MAHKKGAGSTRNGRNSNAQRRGVKVYGGTEVVAGNILVRQVGGTFVAGKNVGTGKDFTLFALIDGVVKFEWKTNTKKMVSVYPVAATTPTAAELSADHHAVTSSRDVLTPHRVFAFCRFDSSAMVEG